MLSDEASEPPSVPFATAVDGAVFEAAPVALWLEDYSGLKRLFERWRAEGVTSLGSYLTEDPERIRICADQIRLLKVNAKTLSVYEADDFEHLVANLDHVFSAEMDASFQGELELLWNGSLEFWGHTVNSTISGRKLDIELKGRILPGHEETWDQVLVVTEDVTERETARRHLAASDEYARGLFDHSPVSLWVEDFSAVKQLMDELRQRGIVDFRVFTDVHPEFVARCMSEIRVIDVNRHTLELFVSPDKITLLKQMDDIFRDNTLPNFREQLIDLWNDKLFQLREVVNYTLDGRELHVLLQFSVLPGHEHDWSLVQVALTDITARKAAEAYLEFLGKHDALTKLHNRSFYIDELNRLQRKAPFPSTIIMADLNGLKETNDMLGHPAGDELLRRVGEIFNQIGQKPAHAARIGGDEFALILPGIGEVEAERVLDNIRDLVDLNNQFYTGPRLSLSMGAATSQTGERLEEVAKRADAIMYEAKRAFYKVPDTIRQISATEH